MEGKGRKDVVEGAGGEEGGESVIGMICKVNKNINKNASGKKNKQNKQFILELHFMLIKSKKVFACFAIPN